jgi:hypothetical protein
MTLMHLKNSEDSHLLPQFQVTNGLPACLPMTPIHDLLQHEPQSLLDQDTHDMSAFEEFWRIPNCLLQFQAIIERGVMLVGNLVENQQAAHGTSKGELLRREWSVGEICK